MIAHYPRASTASLALICWSPTTMWSCVGWPTITGRTPIVFNVSRKRFTRNFNAHHSLYPRVDDSDYYRHVHSVNLTFHGIDTIAEIRLNRQFLGRTDNMFVRYSYDVTKILQDENVLEVEITSPVWAARAKAHALDAVKSSVPPACPPEPYHGECHVNMLRKMQASFAWDWGLAAPSMGLWKSVQLEMYEVALLRDVDVDTSRNETHWNMHITCYLDAVGRQNFYAQLVFYAVWVDPLSDALSTLVSHSFHLLLSVSCSTSRWLWINTQRNPLATCLR